VDVQGFLMLCLASISEAQTFALAERLCEGAVVAVAAEEALFVTTLKCRNIE